MKRILFYIIILLAVTALPVHYQDVADLEPIRAVWVSAEEKTVILQADTGDRGRGETVEEALSQMKRESPGIVYLDTARILLISEGAEKHIPELQKVLKPSVRVCRWNGNGALSTAADFAQAHKTGVKLGEWTSAVKLPNLPEEIRQEKGEMPT